MNGANKKIKKLIAPIIITVIMIAFCAGMIAFFIWLKTIDPIPWYLLLIMIAVYAAIMFGVIYSLIQRFKEIKGGEEDEASKY